MSTGAAMLRPSRRRGPAAQPTPADLPLRGFGLGLRPEHYLALLAEPAGVDWLEALSENYMVPGGKPLHYLERLRAERPFVMHGVAMSLGGTDPLDTDYLRELRALARRLEPAWISDHLCFTGVDGRNLHDLLPLPHTEAALRHVADRIARVQDALGQRIAVENASSYLRFAADEMSEPEFVAALVRRADCRLLLDVNNVWVNSVNHRFDPAAYIDAMPGDRVVQIHLAGHSIRDDGFLIDTHDAPVCDEVWALYRHTLRTIGFRPTMIERDDHIPPLAELVAELDIARRIAASVEAEATTETEALAL